MKNKSVFLLLLAAFFSRGICAGQTPDISLREKERQARELAKEVLNGREIVVRVYDDLENDPLEYKTLRVRLEGLSFSYKKVKEIFPDISESTVIVILGTDQTDPAVVAVLGNYICSGNFQADRSQNIWPELSNDYRYLIFTDALGNPIPDAKLEVRAFLIPRSRSRPEDIEVTVGTAVLDSHGRYNSPIWGNLNYGLRYIISHPNYGTVSVRFHRGPDASNIYVLPLVPLDSEAAGRSFRGYVVDDNEEPVGSLPVYYEILGGNGYLKRYGPSDCTVITDEKGWFNIYAPIEENGELSTELVPETIRYEIRIVPPKSLYMSPYDSMLAGIEGFSVGQEPKKIVLYRMDPNQYYHTLRFEDSLGEITEPAELETIVITLSRNDRVWQSLNYEQFSEGCYLHEGTLNATMKRWGKSFRFQPINLTEVSPEELVFTSGAEKIYQGLVVDVKTGEPVPNVLIVAGSRQLIDDDLAKLMPQIDELRSRAKTEASEGLSSEYLYQSDNRVTLTDRNGFYRFVFKPGLSSGLNYFVALDNNYYARPVHVISSIRTNAQRMIDVPEIQLLPPQAQYPPVFFFEDHNGSIITDPNILDEISLEIIYGEGGRKGSTYKYFKNSYKNDSSRLTYGTYHASLNYGQFSYEYEPVVVNWDSPGEIVFKLKALNDNEVILQGKAVHGITGEPMPDVIIFVNNSLSRSRFLMDFPDYTKIWDTINSIGDDFNPDNPAFETLNQALNAVAITRTDQDGRFELRAERQYLSVPTMSYTEAIKENFLSARQSFDYMLPIDKNSPEPTRRVNYEPNENGIIVFPEMRMFPSAQIAMELNFPDTSSDGRRTRLTYNYRTEPDYPVPWLEKFWETPRARMGALIVRFKSLQPNGRQSISVPAGVKLDLKIYSVNDQWTGVKFAGIELEQGQCLDLGKVEFPATFKVFVKAIDSRGKPLQNVGISCADINGDYWGQRATTDSAGLALIYLEHNSKGEFVVAHRDRETNELFREGIHYEVGGEEDAGKEFVLQLSDEMIGYVMAPRL